jgi:hypothetical protein
LCLGIAVLGPLVVLTAATDPGQGRVVLSRGFAHDADWSLTYSARSRRPCISNTDQKLDQRDSEPVSGRQSADGQGVLIGYARCSTDRQDLAAQRHTLSGLGVSDDRVYHDHRMTGRNRKRPGLQ